MSEFDKNPENSNSDSESDNDEKNTNQINQINQMNQTNQKKDKKRRKKNKSKNNDKSQQSKPLSTIAKIILERKRLQEEEDARILKLQEEEDRKIKEEEEKIAAEKKKEQEEKEKKLKAKHDKILLQKIAGTYKTKSEKEREKKNQIRLEQMKKQGIIGENGSIIMRQNGILNTMNINSDFDKHANTNETIQNLNEKKNTINYRCPLFTIMGHVDTGKTTLLDWLRKTSVQSHEVGGITQQIGTTMLSKDIIFKELERINCLKSNKDKIKIPGLLLVDTPGHEAFKGLRKLGSKLADIVLIIVDIMHGLEQQTIESINLLIESNIPFIFVLNKIDRLYGWDSELNNLSIQEIIKNQEPNTISEFNSRFKQIQTQIMSLGINNELFWLNTSQSDTLNVIPLSALTGQGMPDLLNIVIEYFQTTLKQQIEWVNKLECIIMEITNIEGYGCVLDCVLKNGKLTQGDIIKIQTQNNDIILRKIKNILTIPENKDSKDTNKYISHTSIAESNGIKIVAQDIEKSLIGSCIEIGSMNEYENHNSSSLEVQDANKKEIKLDPQGISIYAPTQGSLESFIEFIKTNNELPNPIKISHVSIGKVIKKDLLKFNLVNSSDTENIIPEYNCVLAFEVDIDKDGYQYAKENNIKIFEDKTIYKLFNQYKEYAIKQYEERKEKARKNTVFPCILKIIESNIFNKKNPLVMGVDILEGTLHIGTPLIILPSKTFIGCVVGIQINKQDVKLGKCGQSVCIKIDNQSNPNIQYGRQFEGKDLLYSNLSRTSIDLLKEYFKKDMSKEDISLLVKLKKLIGF